MQVLFDPHQQACSEEGRDCIFMVLNNIYLAIWDTQVGTVRLREVLFSCVYRGRRKLPVNWRKCVWKCLLLCWVGPRFGILSVDTFYMVEIYHGLLNIPSCMKLFSGRPIFLSWSPLSWGFILRCIKVERLGIKHERTHILGSSSCADLRVLGQGNGACVRTVKPSEGNLSFVTMG